jgi:hypothetical protein
MLTSAIAQKISMAAAGAALMALSAGGAAQAATIVRGSIDSIPGLPGFIEVDYWDFTVNSAGTVEIDVLANGIDFGNGASGLNSYLRLFKNDGSLNVSDFIKHNDNASLRRGGRDGSVSNFDSFLSKSLDIGSYTLAISDGFLSNREAVAGLQRDTIWGGTGDYQLTFTGDVTVAGVDNAEPTSVPEPASLLGLLAVGAFGAGSAFKRKQQA